MVPKLSTVFSERRAETTAGTVVYNLSTAVAGLSTFNSRITAVYNEENARYLALLEWNYLMASHEANLESANN
jgi:hypothetical protein